MSKIILTEKQVNELFNKLQEEVDLDNYEAPFSSDDFINWVNSEYDLDLLLGNSSDTKPPNEDSVEWFLGRGSGTSAHFASAFSIAASM